VQITQDQIKQSALAMLEVLRGADARRILEISDHLVLGKALLAQLASGQVVIVPVPPTLNEAPAVLAKANGAHVDEQQKDGTA
jgi:hypothetical protein